MAQMPLAKAAAKPTPNETAPTAAMSATALRASKAPLPAMIRTARRKLNSAASVGPRPLQSAALIVDPDREIPGRMATAWARPVASASPAVSPLSRGVDQRVDQRKIG